MCCLGISFFIFLRIENYYFSVILNHEIFLIAFNILKKKKYISGWEMKDNFKR